MKAITFLTIFFIAAYLPLKLFSQHADPFKKINIKYFLPLDSILEVKIYDSWTQKKYNLSATGLNKLKRILERASVTQNLLLKPGHLYMIMKFKNRNTFKNYEIYMYPRGIYFSSDYLSKKPSYSIELKKIVNWTKLNDN